ncbi:DUF397 domain-containing protein [Gandjariella thermophila]|uniref:DUF397 domain-containing protein n=1 Tax=Gandjariella thermophila TaxID=1931992 RepID=A0A4D4J8W5_9PSEU|nr:DUF397 domain-containing protein [Gandjariella thermophila]GDY33265.1 hypothetical protein GTS_48980 [Gandjariella thermophila]
MSTVDVSGARWRKSTRSGEASSTNCVEVALVAVEWRKSTRSGDANQSAYVEVAFSGPAAAIRDSKAPANPPLVLPLPAWHAFLTSTKRGDLNLR